MTRMIKSVKELLDLPQGSILFVELPDDEYRKGRLGFAMRNEYGASMFSVFNLGGESSIKMHCGFKVINKTEPYKLEFSDDDELRGHRIFVFGPPELAELWKFLTRVHSPHLESEADFECVKQFLLIVDMHQSHFAMRPGAAKSIGV